MAQEALIQGEFKIVTDPEYRVSERAGKPSAWLKIRGMNKPRTQDANGAWVDGEPLFMDIIIGQGAEHLFESVVKGDAIIVTGKLKQRNYEFNGQQRTTIDLIADTVGVSTRWGTAKTQAASESNGTANIASATAALTTPQPEAAPF